MVVFPDKNTLGIFAKLSDFAMPLYGLKVSIKVANIDPEASSRLHTVWIQVYDIPGIAKEVELVKEIVNLVAEPIAVDEVSLIKPRLVRVQGRFSNPSLIKGSIEFFFNGNGIPISFKVEDSKGSNKGGRGPPGSGSGKPRGNTDKDNDNHQQGDRKRGNDKFQRIGRIDMEMESNQDDSMEECMLSEKTDEGSRAIPLATFHPMVGHIIMEDNSSFIAQETQQMPVDSTSQTYKATILEHENEKSGAQTGRKEGEYVKDSMSDIMANDNQFVIHGRDGPYLMDKCKWPKLSLLSELNSQDQEDLGVLTQEDKPLGISLETDTGLGNLCMGEDKERHNKDNISQSAEDFMDYVSDQSKCLDLDSDGVGWQSPKLRKSKKKNKKKIVVATRTNSRVPR